MINKIIRILFLPTCIFSLNTLIFANDRLCGNPKGEPHTALCTIAPDENGKIVNKRLFHFSDNMVSFEVVLESIDRKKHEGTISFVIENLRKSMDTLLIFDTIMWSCISESRKIFCNVSIGAFPNDFTCNLIKVSPQVQIKRTFKHIKLDPNSELVLDFCYFPVFNPEYMKVLRKSDLLFIEVESYASQLGKSFILYVPINLD